MKKPFWLIAVILFCLPSTLTYAGAREKAENFCAAYITQYNKACNVEKCPCGGSKSKLKKFDRKGLRIALCACSNHQTVSTVTTCGKNSDCDDGIFCNGVEVCRPGDSSASVNGCVATASPCLNGETCSEVDNRCVAPGGDACRLGDLDGDGHVSVNCGGDDCDDADRNRFPGNHEVCDSRGHDEDCDPRTSGSTDRDGDGYISSACR